LFFLRGVAPPEITTRHIYAGIIPFVLIQLCALAVLWFVPGLATWLPRVLYGGQRMIPKSMPCDPGVGTGQDHAQKGSAP
jgi:hypothetical protein